MIKILAIAVALVLSLGITSSAFAQATNNDTTSTPAAGCDTSYPDVCITPRPPDLDCKEIGVSNFAVVGNDPHDFDRDSDGIGCERPGPEDEAPVPVPVPETPVNETGTENGTIPTPEPIPPVITPVPEGNETGSGENQTEIPTPTPAPIPETPVNETGTGENQTEVPTTPGNETAEPECIPNANFTGNAVVDANVAVNQTNCPETPIPPVFEPPTGDNQTGNQTTGNQTQGNQTTTPTPEPAPTEPEQPTSGGNATDAFDQLQNSTAVLDQKLDEVLDDANDENRGELKAALDEAAGAIGGTSGVIVNATNDQLLILQGTFVSGSESIDEVLNGEVAEEPEEEEDENGE